MVSWGDCVGIGKRIKLALHEEGLTIKTLSEQSGISINTLYSITKRDSARIDSITLDKIAEALDLPAAFFTAEPPFDDLNQLALHKEAILSMMDSQGLLYGELIPKPDAYKESFKDYPDVDYWRRVGDHLITFRNEEASDYLPADVVKLLNEEDSEKVELNSLLSAYSKLNAEGQHVAVERVQELSEIKKYQKGQ